PDGLAALRVLSSRTELAVVVMVPSLSTDVLQQALRAGVKDVLPADADADQLRAAVERAAASLPAPGAPGAAPGDPTDCRVITVFSTKGGAGKSVVAANLAVTLARRESRPVVLIDGDLQFGDIAVMMKLAPEHTIVDAVT